MKQRFVDMGHQSVQGDMQAKYEVYRKNDFPKWVRLVSAVGVKLERTPTLRHRSIDGRLATGIGQTRQHGLGQLIAAKAVAEGLVPGQHAQTPARQLCGHGLEHGAEAGFVSSSLRPFDLDP